MKRKSSIQHPASSIQFAANNRQVAKALGLKPSRAQLVEVGDWRKIPGFPVKHKGERGFRTDELRSWYEKFLADYADADYQKLRALRDAKLKQIFAEGKPLNKDQKAELRLLGIAVGDEVERTEGTEGTEAGAGARNGHPVSSIQYPASSNDLSKNANTQAELAARLQAFYGNRISIVIDATCISDWRKGRRLDGVPPPPAKRGNYFIMREWVEWFDANLLGRFIIQHDPQGKLLPDLAVRSRDADYLRAIHQEQILKLDLERKAGRFVEVDFVKRQLLPVISKAINQQCVDTERLLLAWQNWRRSQGLENAGPELEWWSAALQAENRAWLESQKRALGAALVEAEGEAKQLMNQ